MACSFPTRPAEGAAFSRSLKQTRDSIRRDKHTSLPKDPGGPATGQDHRYETSTLEEDSPSHCLNRAQHKAKSFLKKYTRHMIITLYVVLILLYVAYFSYAMYFDWKRNTTLIIFTSIALAYCLYVLIEHFCGEKINSRIIQPTHRAIARKWKYLRWCLLAAVIIGIIVYIAVDAAHNPIQLVSGGGLFVFVIIGFLCSKSPSKVYWQPIYSGCLLQFIMALLIIRWKNGYQVIKFVGDQATTFLAYADVGARFVFGEKFEEHDFVFKAMPVVIFFGGVIQMLYYLGIVQYLIKKIGYIMYALMGVGPAEAFVAATNIFLGPTSSVLTIVSFLKVMTLSELHCVLTSGFATVTGSLLGVYISFGVPPAHLLSASVMSAPAAIAIARLLYPETQKSKLLDVENIEFEESKERNMIEAFSRGACMCVSLAVCICANLIAFIALLYFVNASLTWFGDRVGIANLTFQVICSYVFMPVSFLMGVPWNDCFEVGRLIGFKIFLNDIAAYSELGKLIRNREAGLQPTLNSQRSEVIATYALCGFANFGDMGICLGAMGALVPARKSDLGQVVIRAMVAGNIACFITACIAGLVYNQH